MLAVFVFQDFVYSASIAFLFIISSIVLTAENSGTSLETSAVVRELSYSFFLLSLLLFLLFLLNVIFLFLLLPQVSGFLASVFFIADTILFLRTRGFPFKKHTKEESSYVVAVTQALPPENEQLNILTNATEWELPCCVWTLAEARLFSMTPNWRQISPLSMLCSSTIRKFCQWLKWRVSNQLKFWQIKFSVVSIFIVNIKFSLNNFTNFSRKMKWRLTLTQSSRAICKLSSDGMDACKVFLFNWICELPVFEGWESYFVGNSSPWLLDVSQFSILPVDYDFHLEFHILWWK